MQSSTLPMPTDVRWRRLLGVAIFIGLLWLFRRLAPVLICFVILERTLGWAAEQIEKRTKIHRHRAVLAVLGVLTALLGVAVLLAVRRAIPLVRTLREEGRDWIEALLERPAVAQLRHFTGMEGEDLIETVKHHAAAAIGYATSAAHLVVFLLIGFVLALIYLFEREEIDRWLDGLSPMSVPGTLSRWLGYLADAIAVTVRMQAVVAVVNAVVTLPVILLLRLPNVPLLFVLILVSGLVPVVGNMISGAVLCLVAYQAHGWWAVAVFLVATFVLHKIESYYLNPRLAAQHVKLPGIVLVVSLLLFEQIFGFAGLFLSFPALYVAIRIANEWEKESGPVISEPGAEPG